MYKNKPNAVRIAKNSTIYTPKEVSEFIFELLRWKIPRTGIIFDPCSGEGSLLKPWQEIEAYQALGNDNDSEIARKYNFFNSDFLTSDIDDWKRRFQVCSKYYTYRPPTLILCNPPFCGNKSKLLPEIWFDKIIEIFGKEVSIVFFAPIGFRLNSTLKSKRYFKFINGAYPPIISQISLTRDIYNLEPNNRKTEFHSEILIFNIRGLEPHYFFKYGNFELN